MKILKGFRKCCALLLAIIMCSSLVACKGGKTDGGEVNGEKDDTLSRGYLYEKQQESLFQFYSSDASLDAFINDYMERHLRYNENAIDPMPIGAGNTIWKEWDTMAARYMNTAALGYDPMSTVKNWANNIFQDEFGYIWMDNGTDSSSWGQGWEFPNTSHSKGNNKAYNFNDKDNNEGWASVSDTGVVGSVANGSNTVEGNAITSIVYQTGAGITKMAETFHAPFVELSLNLLDKDSLGGTNLLEDIVLSWTTSAEPTYDAAKTVTYSKFSNTKFDKLPSSACIVFPMYAHEKWAANQVVTGMKIEFKFKSSMNVSLGLNRIRLNYDARQINNNGLYIKAVKDYLEYTNDTEFLKNNLTKLRKAMQFYFTYCNGGSGLISTSNFTGHDGSTNGNVGHGIGDGYWDIVSYPMVSTYCNNVYYNALKAMLWLEKAADDLGVDYDMPSVSNASMTTIETYNQTATSLETLLKKCSDEYNKLFWDESVGRYILGYNANNQKVDYGYTLFNQEAVLYGIASEEQALKIASWIDGERVINGDDSTGEDIYFYDFAPRWSTKQNANQYYWPANGVTQYPFSQQVQNGGTAVHDAYYDLAATNVTKGTESSFKKLQNIQKWYEDVKSAGGKGQRFYTDYYMPKWIADKRYRLQGGGANSPHAGAGAIGLDTEFIEAAILCAVVPDLYFGLSADSMGTLNINPALPQSLTFWKMENCAFGGTIYDLSIGKTFVQINSIRGNADGLKLKVTLDKPASSYEVRQHTTVLQKDKDYIEKEGKIIVSAAFKNGRIQVISK